MRLAFDDYLQVSNRADYELAQLADRHYSRVTIGSAQFTGPGSDLTLRDARGDVVFVWIWHNAGGKQLDRWDRLTGYCCALFRNESSRKASDIILEAERLAFQKWGPNRLYTYIDPKKTRIIKRRGRRVIGFCYLKAGWKPLVHLDGSPRMSKDGKHLLVKLHHGR